MSAISFQSVSKTFQTARGPFQALDGVRFDIEDGEFFGLLGPNGAGKTTLISILAGLAQATSGAVLVRGVNVATQSAQARRMLGVVPQELVFDPFFNVREALKFQSGYFGVKHNDDWIDELLHSLGLADKANNNMRQPLMICPQPSHPKIHLLNRLCEFQCLEPPNPPHAQQQDSAQFLAHRSRAIEQCGL